MQQTRVFFFSSPQTIKFLLKIEFLTMKNINSMFIFLRVHLMFCEFLFISDHFY